MKPVTFAVHVDEAALADLRGRLSRTRFSDDIHAGSWIDGVPADVLRRIVDHWRDRFDWRASERRINRMPQFQAELRGLKVHFLHVKGVDEDSQAQVIRKSRLARRRRVPPCFHSQPA